ncbi:MAG: hypothetical protein LBU72_01155 [Burkholderiaceae bacterium]|jgi:hypothetical protein|nr:hypothetical protein [Burkholderiaceae bacterium]
MTFFTDCLYDQWRRSVGGSGVLLTTGRPALPGQKTSPQKAKRQRFAVAGVSVQLSNTGDSNHGIKTL